MWDRGTHRAISPIKAAVLLIAFIATGMAIQQAQVVPNQNQKIEFKHSQRVQDDMVPVRNAILEDHTTGEDQFSPRRTRDALSLPA